MSSKLFHQPVIFIFLTAILASAGFFVFKTILPAKEKAIAQSAALNHWQETNWNIPVIFGYAPSHQPFSPIFYTDNRGVVIADANGDGLPDLLQANNLKGERAVYLNNGQGDFIYDQNWQIPDNVNFDNPTGSPSMVADLNGDGFVDILNGWYTPSSSDYRTAFINNKDGKWMQNNNWKPPVYFYRNEGENGVRLVDINGDGLVDIVWALIDMHTGMPNGIHQEIYLNQDLRTLTTKYAERNKTSQHLTKPTA